MTLTDLLPSLESALEIDDKRKALHRVSAILQNKVGHYTWVGFYFMNHTDKTLHLGPYTGLPTEHTVINYGKGICGQVAVSGKTYVADDVSQEDNYIACSIDVHAEIVLPIFDEAGVLIAQLDIDSNKRASFTQDDERFLTDLCIRIGKNIAHRLGHQDFL
jgi:L-methionine (R)-S-oxide reductase